MDDLAIAIYAIDEASRVLLQTAESITRLERKVEESDQRYKKHGLTLTDMWSGYQMVRQAVDMIGSAFEAAVGPAVKLESEFAKIEGLTDTPAAAIDGLRDSVIDLSKEIPVSSQEMAEALYFISSSGFQGAEAMDILTMSSKAAAAGLGESKVIADAVTSSLNAYKLEGSDAARITDILIETVRQGKGEPDELAGSLGRILPIAAAAGVSMEQVAASMATMTRTGLNADEAATALRGTIGALMAPGKQAQEALAALGLSADDVRQSIKDRGLLETLAMLMDRTGGNVEILDLLIPNVRALTGVLSTAGSQAGAYTEILAKMNQASGATEKAFAVMSDTVESKAKRLENSLGAIRDKLATELLPVLSDAADAADLLINGQDRINEAFDATHDKIVMQAASYEEYRQSTMATAAAAGYASQANVDAWNLQSDAALRGTYIYDIMLQKTGMLTQAQWESARAEEQVAMMGDFANQVAQASANASGQSAEALAAKEAADRAEAQAAFENAQAAEEQAKAQEKSRKEAADATIAYMGLAESLKGATTAQIAQQAISNLDQSLKTGAITPAEYTSAVRGIQLAYDLVTPKSIALGDALTKLNQLYDGGKITSAQYTDAVGKLDKAATDGKVTMAELGINIESTGGKMTIAEKKVEGLAGEMSDLTSDEKDAQRAADSLTTSLNRIPRTINVKVKIDVEGEVPDIPGRATGGEVYGGWPYWVGEEGPEPFIPASGGRILSRSDAMAAMRDSTSVSNLITALRHLSEVTAANKIPQSGIGPSVTINAGAINSEADMELLAWKVAAVIQGKQ